MNDKIVIEEDIIRRWVARKGEMEFSGNTPNEALNNLVSHEVEARVGRKLSLIELHKELQRR